MKLKAGRSINDQIYQFLILLVSVILRSEGGSSIMVNFIDPRYIVSPENLIWLCFTGLIRNIRRLKVLEYRLYNRSCMTGDCHVQFCERLRGKFPWPTLQG
jgi:hypothetical protein